MALAALAQKVTNGREDRPLRMMYGADYSGAALLHGLAASLAPTAPGAPNRLHFTDAGATRNLINRLYAGSLALQPLRFEYKQIDRIGPGAVFTLRLVPNGRVLAADDPLFARLGPLFPTSADDQSPYVYVLPFLQAGCTLLLLEMDPTSAAPALVRPEAAVIYRDNVAAWKEGCMLGCPAGKQPYLGVHLKFLERPLHKKALEVLETACQGRHPKGALSARCLIGLKLV
jgi:hypothetical protein